MTRDLSINFGQSVTTPYYQLMASDGSLGSHVTAGFVNVVSGIYFLSQIDLGAARGIYWNCVEGFEAFDLLYPNQDGNSDSIASVKAAVFDSVVVSGNVLTLSNGSTQTITEAGRVTA